MRRLFALAALLAWVIAWPAAAETARLPKTGEPALLVDVPSGWNPVYDDLNNLQIFSLDNGRFLQLTMLKDPNVERTPLSRIAESLLQSAGVPKHSRSEPKTVAGIEGEAFYSQTVPTKGVAVNFTLILVKVDGTHVAVLTRATRVDDIPAGMMMLDDMIGGIRVIRRR